MLKLLSINKIFKRLLLCTIILLLCVNESLALKNDTISFSYTKNDCGNGIVDFKASVDIYNAADCIFSWNFGDGTTAIGQQITHNFLVAPGEIHLVNGVEPFNVTLTVFYDGLSKQISISHPVTVRAAPVPFLIDMSNTLEPFKNCSNNPTRLKPYYNISLSDKSIYSQFITKYIIEWGDGSPNEEFLKNQFPPLIKHTYNQLGQFLIKYSTIGDNGCTTTKEYLADNQSNPGVGISTTGNTGGCAPVIFSFKLSGIKENDPSTLYSFNFGDGDTLTWTHKDVLEHDSIIEHEYRKGSCDQPDKAFTASVIARNNCDFTLSLVGSIRVASKPNPRFTTIAPLCEGKPISFYNNLNSACNITYYTWNFGDGSSPLISVDNALVEHTFPTDKNRYIVSLTAHSLCTDVTFTDTVTLISKPVELAKPSATFGCVPMTVKFTDHSSAGELWHQWIVSPNSNWSMTPTPSSDSPTFTFTKAGIYVVTHKVSNICGDYNAHNYIITVKDIPAVTLSPISNQCNSFTFIADKQNFDVSSKTTDTLNFHWTVTPNRAITFLNSTSDTSKYPVIQIADTGSFVIKAEASNSCGTTTATTPVRINEITHNISSIIDTLGCTYTQISFKDHSTGTNLKHTWTITPTLGYIFITGNSTSKEIALLFFQTGDYVVKHIVDGDCGSEAKSFKIKIFSKPLLNLSYITNQCSIPFRLNIDTSNFKILNGLESFPTFIWKISPSDGVTFEDQTSSTSTYPHIQFTKYGQYTISVNAINRCGESSTSQTISIIAPAVENAKPSTTSGCVPLPVTFNDLSSGDQLFHQWTVTPAGNWSISSTTAASPIITFNKAGIYRVIHQVANQCGFNQHDYWIKVKEPPTAFLKSFTSSCSSFVFNAADAQNFTVNLNQNDTISYAWSVTPLRAVTFLNNTSDTSKYPTIQIADTGKFMIRVAIKNECMTVFKSTSIDIRPATKLVTAISDTVGCNPKTIIFTDTSIGSNLKHTWSVSPAAGFSITNGSEVSKEISIVFSQPGVYTVTHKIEGDCGTDSKSWTIRINGKPIITFTPIIDTCDNFTFKAERHVSVRDNGIPVRIYNWTITPANSFSYIDGTTNASPLPHIAFGGSGTYQITLNVTNDCGTTTKSEIFTIDKFQQATVGPDSTFCLNSNLIQLAGNPSGGTWKILPATSSALLKVIGNITSFDPSVPGIYKLIYHLGNDYCYSEATKQYTVVALPVVNAGPDFKICTTETKPVTLTGTPAGGIWTGTGMTGNTFSTTGLPAGPYILKYTYTDPFTLCKNTDQLVATVNDVPVIDFNAPKQGGINQSLTFTPLGPANLNYDWDFGDGQKGTSTGQINHTYLKDGVYNVMLTGTDQSNCAMTIVRKIIIQGDIILPSVTYNSVGCGPVTVKFIIDTTRTTYNGQNHKWDFGEGTIINNAISEKTITYNSGIADTVYNVKLTVSNNFFSCSVNYPITVNAKPYVNFSLPKPWMCSPAVVKFRNLTIGKKTTYYWDFDDGTSSTEFEPTHQFSTGKIAKEFNIKLVAINPCGKDSLIRKFLVKPNSIEVFIEMSKTQACPGDPITFRNLSTDTVSKISSYYWDFGDGTIVNTWDAIHTYTSSGRYSAKLFVDNGCSQAERTEQIDILKPPTLSIISSDTICKTDTLKLQASSNGEALINCRWDFGDGSTGTGLSTTHVYNSRGMKTITFTAASASNILNCTNTKTKKVFINDSPQQISLPDLSGCSPLNISIPTPGNDSYLWNFGDDNSWSGIGKHTYTITGSQPVRKKVTILSENNSLCRNTTIFWVTIYPKPVAKMQLRSEGGYPENVYFKNLSTNSTICEWLFPDGNIVYSCDSILRSFYKSGFSKITLKASNQYGCIDTTSVIHETMIKGLYVPNALQPSNSDPLVRIFKPVGIGLKTYHLSIYDIWGNLIWETDKINNTETVEGWDGKNKSGKELQQGVYIWRIMATFIDDSVWKGMKTSDNSTKTEGSITLIR